MPDPMTREELLEALERERTAMIELLPRFTEERWRSVARADGWTVHDIATHLADSNYGLALMALGELAPALPIDEQTGWMNPDDLNEQRRQKNTSLPREKVMSRMASSFAHARRAIETIDDLDAPGPYGPVHTRRQWLERIVHHAQEHRRELEEILSP